MPEIVAVAEGVCVGDVDGDNSALGVIDGEAPEERLAVKVAEDEATTVLEGD